MRLNTSYSEVHKHLYTHFCTEKSEARGALTTSALFYTASFGRYKEIEKGMELNGTQQHLGYADNVHF